MTDVYQGFDAVFEEQEVALSSAVALPHHGLCFPFHLPASSSSFCLDRDSLSLLIHYFH